MENADKIVLFGPGNSHKSLFRQYPELSEVKEFKVISKDDLLFVWYLGNKSSPIDPDWPEMVRYKTAASYAIKDEATRIKYANGEVPDNVKEAVERMKMYSPDARMLAKRMVQTMFHNLQRLVDIDVTSDFNITEYDKEGNIKSEFTDFTGRKQYIDSCKTVSQTLPELIKQMEEGFGVKGKNEVEVGKKAIDRFHQNNRENS